MCITESEYSLRYERYRQEQRLFDNKLKQLTRTDDDYYMKVIYLVEIAKRAGELFRCSKADEKRQLMALVLSNIRVSGKKVLYEVQKPFDAILKYAERPLWGELVDSFVNRKAGIHFTLPELESFFADMGLENNILPRSVPVV